MKEEYAGSIRNPWGFPTSPTHFQIATSVGIPLYFVVVCVVNLLRNCLDHP